MKIKHFEWSFIQTRIIQDLNFHFRWIKVGRCSVIDCPYWFVFTLLAFFGRQRKNLLVQGNMFPHCAYDYWILNLTSESMTKVYITVKCHGEYKYELHYAYSWDWLLGGATLYSGFGLLVVKVPIKRAMINRICVPCPDRLPPSAG